MADSIPQQKYKVSLEHQFILKIKKMLDSNEDMSKEHGSQLEGAPTGKIWDNLSFNMCDEL